MPNVTISSGRYIAILVGFIAEAKTKAHIELSIIYYIIHIIVEESQRLL